MTLNRDSSLSGGARRRTPKRLHLVLAVSGLLFWAFLIYGNSFEASFHFDDEPNIVDNPAIRISSLSPTELTRAATESPLRPRPVAYVTFAFNHYFHGLDVTGYHIANVAIHGLTAVGLFVAVLLLLGLPALDSAYADRRQLIAWCTAFVWVSHPVHVQAVTYIVQRMASMAGMFVVWSLAAFLWAVAGGGRKRLFRMSLAIALFLLGIGTKETAVVLPVMIVAGYPLLSGKGVDLKRVVAYLSGSLLIGAGAVSLVWGPRRMLDFFSSGMMAGAEHLLTLPRAVFYTLSLLAAPLPSRFGLVHDLPPSTSLWDPPTTLVAAVLLIAACVLPLLLARRHPLLSVCLLWFLLLLLPEQAVSKHNPVFEHRLYLSSMGPVLAACLGLSRLTLTYRKQVVASLVAVVVALLSVMTFHRNTVWKDEVSLWKDSVRNAPRSVRGYPNLIAALAREGRQAEAEEHYEKMISLEIRRPYEYYFVGKSAFAVKRYEEAARMFEGALAINPGYCVAREALAEAYAWQGRIGDALAELRAFQNDCVRGSALKLNVVAKLNAAKLMEAAEQSMNARILENPEDLQARLTLSGLLMNRGAHAEAVEHLRIVLDKEPENAAAWSNLGFCAFDLGDPRAAEAHQRTAIEWAPGLASAHYGLAIALAAQGRRHDAALSFRRYLALAPPHDAFRAAAASHLRQLEGGEELPGAPGND